MTISSKDVLERIDAQDNLFNDIAKRNDEQINKASLRLYSIDATFLKETQDNIDSTLNELIRLIDGENKSK
jgi:hypothetical protein